MQYVSTAQGKDKLTQSSCKSTDDINAIKMDHTAVSDIKVSSVTLFTHYANIPMQYTAIFHSCKNDNFQSKSFDYFHIFAQNIDCGYMSEPPRRGGSNEYPKSLF